MWSSLINTEEDIVTGAARMRQEVIEPACRAARAEAQDKHVPALEHLVKYNKTREDSSV